MKRIEIKYDNIKVEFDDINEIDDIERFKSLVEGAVKNIDFEKAEKMWEANPMKWWKNFKSAVLESISVSAYIAYSRKSLSETEFAIVNCKELDGNDLELSIYLKAPGMYSFNATNSVIA